MRKRFLILGMILFLFLFSGCDLIESVAPPPADTPVPSEAPARPTETPRPTLGERQFIDAVYCWESHIDDGEFNLIRFFPSGELIDVFVQPYQSCQAAYDATKAYLTQDNLMTFSHGIYSLSGEWIEFTLSPANASEVVGEVTGTYAVDTLTLLRLGSEARDYIRLDLGE